MSFLAAGRHGVRNVFRFAGRDTRTMFWFWALWLFIGYQLLGILAGMTLVVWGNDLFFEPVAPATVDVVSSAHLTVFRTILTISLATAILIAGLLAGAVARRLHDSDLRGWWGVLPMPFLLFGVAAMLRVFTSEALDMALFAAVFVNNLVYLVTLIVLVILLCRAGTPGPNRFGDPGA